MANTNQVEVSYNKYGKKIQQLKVIKCPFCSFEYLPGEILNLEDVIGCPTKIIRDPLGKIIYAEYQEGNEPISEDVYVCDNCNKEFLVSIDSNIKSSLKPEETDFNNPTVKLW